MVGPFLQLHDVLLLFVEVGGITLFLLAQAVVGGLDLSLLELALLELALELGQEAPLLCVLEALLVKLLLQKA